MCYGSTDKKTLPSNRSSILPTGIFAILVFLVSVIFPPTFTSLSALAKSPVTEGEKDDLWDLNRKKIEFFIDNYVWLQLNITEFSIFSSRDLQKNTKDISSRFHAAGLDEKDWATLAAIIAVNIELVGLQKDEVSAVKKMFRQSYENMAALPDKSKSKESPNAEKVKTDVKLMEIAYRAVNEKNIKLVAEYKTDIQRVLNEYRRKKLANDKRAKENKEYQAASALCRQLASRKQEPNNKGFGVDFNKINVKPAYEACSTAARFAKATRQDQYRLGRVATKRKSYKLAMEFFGKSAKRGYAPAQAGIGFLYNNGFGVGKDFRLAMQWYRKAADQGDASAQANIGTLYRDGFGVGKDYRLAMQWYRKAADQGDALAQANIGFLYNNGFGVGKDYRLAMQWYRKAADQGDAFSQGSLGILYHNGSGVPKDFKKARFWYKKAAAQGDESAKKNLKLLEKAERKPSNQGAKGWMGGLEAILKRRAQQQNSSRGRAASRRPTPDSVWCETNNLYAYTPTMQIRTETICWDKDGWGTRQTSMFSKCKGAIGWCRP